MAWIPFIRATEIWACFLAAGPFACTRPNSLPYRDSPGKSGSKKTEPAGADSVFPVFYTELFAFASWFFLGRYQHLDFTLQSERLGRETEGGPVAGHKTHFFKGASRGINDRNIA